MWTFFQVAKYLSSFAWNLAHFSVKKQYADTEVLENLAPTQNAIFNNSLSLEWIIFFPYVNFLLLLRRQNWGVS